MRELRRPKDRAREYVEERLAAGDYDNLADILRGVELLPRAPKRSTFYRWVGEWRERRARDRSGAWALKTDATGRPDIVMSVRAALIGRARGRNVIITVAEAEWLVRLATAVPDILADGTYRGSKEGEPAWGTLSLWSWALNYVDAETAGDLARLTELDGSVAMIYAAGGRHFPEAMREEDPQ